MVRLRLSAAIALIVGFAITSPAVANEQLAAALKQLGKGVDDMSVNISKAENDADAELLVKVTREALDNGLKQDKPKIEIHAKAGFCQVTIETPGWKLWSEAREGKIVDHGATVY
jgi:hypothetical protein